MDLNTSLPTVNIALHTNQKKNLIKAGAVALHLFYNQTGWGEKLTHVRISIFILYDSESIHNF